MNYDYDVCVLGAGPGGYETAIRCSQYGLKTLVVEKDHLGGVCLNRGCIPTKALLHGAELYQNILHGQSFGIEVKECSLNFEKLMAHKTKTVQKLRRGVQMLLQSHQVEVVKGHGRILDTHTIEVNQQKWTAQNIIIATGSENAKPMIEGIHHPVVITSDEALSLNQRPESLVIVGGGVIGIEFAAFFSAVGAKVTVLEAVNDVLPAIDKNLRTRLVKVLEGQGIRFVTGAKVQKIAENGEVTYLKDGNEQKVQGEKCFISVGRRPNSGDIGLENLQIRTTNGAIDVNDKMQTSTLNIYAIGDVTMKQNLAHTAVAQGMVAAANCSGKEEKMVYNAIPSCIYTHPEVASIGMNQQEAQQMGKKVAVGQFDVQGSGRAMASGESEGFVQLISDQETGEILGAQIFAPRATDMIGEIAVAMKSEATIEEIVQAIHPHPTYSEMLMEAAQDTFGQSCNKPKRREKQ